MLFDELNYLIEKTSKKEQNRINKFLKEHNYDPKTKTIEIDEKDKNGKKKRVKFNITNGPVFDDAVDYRHGDVNQPEINMPHKTLKRKPMISHGVFKHEEGHIVDDQNPDRFKELKKKIKPDIKYHGDHGNDVAEYIADNYSINHSKYGIAGFNKMMNALRVNESDVDKRISKINKRLSKNPPDAISETEDYKKELSSLKTRCADDKRDLSKLYLEYNKKKKSECIDDKTCKKYEEFISYYRERIKTSEKEICSLEQKIKDIVKEKVDKNRTRGIAPVVNRDEQHKFAKSNNVEVDERMRIGKKYS